MVESAGTFPKLDLRVEAAKDWAAGLFSEVGEIWLAVAGDASFRRYFRGLVDGRSAILMDAPPEIESSAPFVDVCARLRVAGLHAPEIYAQDLSRGYLLLEDLGDVLYRDVLNQDNAQQLFDEIFPALATMATEVETGGLPDYDAGTLLDEMHLFADLYLLRHRGYRLSHRQRTDWMAMCERLANAALEQPQVFVHRDVHSCNLMLTAGRNPGILDFQDAVRGPVTHDFVSLVWDRYIHWPRERIENWMEQFRRMVAPGVAPGRWIRWCDLSGLQRNLRIVGRFAELKYSEGKPEYIELIPMFYRYLLDVLPTYPEFAPVAEWIGSEACAP